MISVWFLSLFCAQCPHHSMGCTFERLGLVRVSAGPSAVSVWQGTLEDGWWLGGHRL